MKRTVGVFFGSSSPEHDVSIITAQLVLSGLRRLGYPVVPVYLTKRGEWLIADELGSLKTFTDRPGADFSGTGWGRYLLDLERSRGKMVFKKKGLIGRTLTVHVAFPAFHGSYGEDGTMQGVFEAFRLPYVGCDVPSSAVAMDKALTKQVCQSAGLPVVDFLYCSRDEWAANRAEILGNIRARFPNGCVVKPVHLGSSIGITKVGDVSGQLLENAMDVAVHYDAKVLVEAVISPLMDVTCCVIGHRRLTASELQESVFSAEVLDFEEKYLKEGGTQLGASASGVVIPARLDPHVTTAVRETAEKVYRTLGCSGIARVDFLYDRGTTVFYVNEVNPLPGTLYEHLWKKSGVELPELLERLLRCADERHAERQELTYTFDSVILTQLKGSKLSGKKLS